MLKKKSKSLCAILLASTLGFTTLVTACNKTSSKEGNNIVYNLGEEVKSIDPALNSTVDGSEVIVNAFEGLYRIDQNKKTVPGIAKSCDISKDGKEYTFKLRSAKWSDGKPVKADDFKYAWLRLLDPKTASSYASQLFYIKGAEDFFNGKIKAENVGINVIDEKTLKVTLESVTPYFLNLLTTPRYMPARKDIIEKHKDDWTLKPETYVTDGPFKMSEFKIKDLYKFVKNENYWDKSHVKPDSVTFKMIADETSSFAAVKNGEIDISDIMPSIEIQNALKDKYALKSILLSNTYLEFNLNNHADALDPQVRKAIGNKYLRQALAYAIDSDKLNKEVFRDGSLAPTGFVPLGIFISKDSKKDFADKKYIDSQKYNDNVKKAKDLLAKAGYKNGNGLPTLTLSYNTKDLNKAVCEAIQQMWSKIGVKVQLQNQEWTAYENSRRTGRFQIARLGWSGDYSDPTTFLDLWRKNNGLNDSHYNNPEYDKLLDKAKNELDKDKRASYLKKAEDILMDDMPSIPISFTARVRAINPKLKGYVATNLDHVYLAYTYKTK